MTNEEMQKLMDFIREMDARTTVKLLRLGITVYGKTMKQNRSEKRWEQTEKRIRALLARTRRRQRRITASRVRSLPLRNTAVDNRLKALSELVERQIRERGKETR
jgi:hypothetical protein